MLTRLQAPRIIGFGKWPGRETDLNAALPCQKKVGDLIFIQDNDRHWLVDGGVSITRPHDGPGRVRTTGPSPRLSRTPVRPGEPASAPGSDGAAILEEAGLGSEVPDLVRSGVLVESL